MRILYDRFLDAGNTPELFYRISINEAIDIIDSCNRRKEQSQKEELQKLISVLDLFGANLIEKVMMTFGAGEGTIFSLTEYVPELFANVKKQITKEHDEDEMEQTSKPQLSSEMQLYKAQRIQHAYRVNQERRRSNQ